MKAKDKNQMFAAIDVGSYALSMKIAEISQGSDVKILDNVIHTVTLGRDSFTLGKVSFDTINETCEVLKKFKQLISEYGITQYKAVATSSVREASNRDYIINLIKLKTGLDIEVISNSQERYLTYKAIEGQIPDYKKIKREGGILVEIGSGSIQVFTFNDNKLELFQNIRLGSLRIRELLSTLEVRTLDFPKILEEYIASSIDNIRFSQSQESFRNLIVLGGDIVMMSGLYEKSNSRPQSKFISKENFYILYKDLIYKSLYTIRKELKMPQENAEILLPTIMILKKFLDITISDKIFIPMITLVDGVLSDQCAKLINPGIPDRYETDILSSAYFIAQKFRFHEAHAKDVDTKSMALFDGLKKLHGLGERERLLLRLAVILHDTGKFISLNEHYLHSYEIIMACEILGISKKELEIVANISRYHSNEVPSNNHVKFMQMDAASRLVTAKLAALIRIADALDRSHRQKIKDIKVIFENNEVTVRVDSVDDILLEEWAFETKADFFQEVFGIAPVMKIKRRT